MPTAAPVDLPAVEQAIRDHHALVYRLAARILGNPHDAEDVTQSVFLHVMRSLDAYRSARSPTAWIARAAVNEAVSWLRAESRRRQREKAVEAKRRAARSGDDSMHEALSSAVRSLPDDLRIPVILHYQEGFKYREIAEVCKCPAGTVARRIARAKERLRSNLVRGGSVALCGALEESLRAQPAAQPPAGLVERLVASATREASRLALLRQDPSLIQNVSPRGGALLGKLAAALGCASILLGIGWYAIDRAVSAGWTPHATAVTAAASDSGRATGLADRFQSRRGFAAYQCRKARRLAALAGAGEGAKPATEAGDGAQDEAAFPKGPHVRGRVTDEAGEPIAGARVAFVDSLAGEPIGEGATTAEDGTYDLVWKNAGAASEAGTKDVALVYTNFVRTWNPDGSAELAEYLEAAQQVDLTNSIIQGELDGLRVVQQPQVVEHLVELNSWQSAMLEGATLTRVQVAEASGGVVNWTSWKTQAASNTHQCQSCHSDPAADEAGAAADDSHDAPQCPARGATCRVRAAVEGFEAEVSDTIELQSSSEVELDFVLRPARNLGGVIVDDRGRPIEGAAVEVVAYSGGSRVPTESLATKSAPDGTFNFSSLPEGIFVLRAGINDDSMLAAHASARVGEKTIRLQLRPSGRIRGIVVDAESGTPLSGYRVEAHDAIGVAASAVTDAQGEVLLTGFAPGTFCVNTYREGSSSQYSRATVEVEAIPGSQANARLEVSGRPNVKGRVVAASGAEAFDGLIAQILPRNGLRRASTERKSAKVDADGSFEVDNVPAGSYRVVLVRQLEGEAFEVAGACDLWVPARAGDVALEVTLDGTSRGAASIQVEDAAGEPVANAEVRIAGGDLDAAMSRWRTDPDGKVRAWLRPGRYTVRVEASGRSPATRSSVDVRPDEETSVAVALDPALPPVRLPEILGGESTLTLRKPVSLPELLELGDRLGWPAWKFGAGLDGNSAASTAAERLTGGSPGPQSAGALLETLLGAGGWTASWSGRELIFEAAP
jgi:RNA polymerase sigma factor (sigma-70 family)